MRGKIALILLVVLVTILGGIDYLLWKYPWTKGLEVLSPITKELSEKLKVEEKPKSELAKVNPLNLLLLGIDRRSKAETSYRTDIMILVSINTETNKVLLISVPRDLWFGGSRINAVYIQQGWEGLQTAFEGITGLKPERFILTDFADFSWIVDAMGGVDVTVENSFMDVEYPNDVTKTYKTISFASGPEKLTGDRALVFSRSRHGNNGEGSDWARMRRQHLILRGMLNAVLQPGSLFTPMNVEKAFTTVTQGKMDTNLQLIDAYYLWDFYKDKDKYSVESVVLDSNYVFNPPMSEYGGAWVLAPIGGTYEPFKTAVQTKLSGTYQTQQPL